VAAPQANWSDNQIGLRGVRPPQPLRPGYVGRAGEKGMNVRHPEGMDQDRLPGDGGTVIFRQHPFAHELPERQREASGILVGPGRNGPQDAVFKCEARARVGVEVERGRELTELLGREARGAGQFHLVGVRRLRSPLRYRERRGAGAQYCLLKRWGDRLVRDQRHAGRRRTGPQVAHRLPRLGQPGDDRAVLRLPAPPLGVGQTCNGPWRPG
jgi:hypothetical protein